MEDIKVIELIPRPTYIKEYKSRRPNGREYMKKTKLPNPGTGGKITGRPRKIIPDELIARAKELRADRYTLAQIHEMTGLTLSTINKILNH